MPDFTTFSVLFFTRKLNAKEEKLSIYARITVNGKCSELSLKRKIPLNKWDPSKSRLKGNSPQIRKINDYLDQVYSKLLDTHKKLLDKSSLITAKKIKASYLGLDEDHKTLNEILEYHNSKMKGVLKWGTLKNYSTTAEYLKLFLNKRKNTDNYYLKQINYHFITEFEDFLRHVKPKKGQRPCGPNGTMKHLERFKKLLNLAIKLEWLDKSPFRSYTFKFEKNDRQFLTERELQKLETTIFKSESLERVKDMFLFSCYSGLSYIDLRELTTNKIVKGMDGNDWIYTKREKTQESVKIPLLNPAKLILNKYLKAEYIDESKVFPVISNQKTNKYLKDIMKAIGVRKQITFHSARHTFATTVTLSNGVPIETVSKILGHSKLSTTQIYARVLENKLSSDINKLDRIISQKNKNRVL
ncbi:site-specific integrase [Christiangramia sp. LLG6405-1]|uniref:site-specific integrase n=1 Tax=Christiangramia sp. LLG6405-1 TaxID=3160832 RepID=UPI003862F0FC